MTDRSRLEKACKGKTGLSGGLSRKQLQTLVKQTLPNWPVDKMTRRALLKQLCPRLCPAVKYIGAEDIIANIDVKDGQFTYKGNPITIQFEKLKQGSYGVVDRATFVSEGQTFNFAVKRSISSAKLEEAIVIEKHTNSVKCPGVISMKVRKYQGKSIAIMPLADGDLEDYIGLLNGKQADQIVRVIGQTLLCLRDQNDYYFDIKPPNILFNCNGKGLSTIYLGDMGSIIADYGEYIATYPPPDHPSGFVRSTEKALKYYTYQLSCLYCQLVSGDSPPSYKTIHYYIWDTLTTLADATEAKLGRSNKYTTVLKTVAKDKNLSRVPNLDVF